MRDEDLHMVIDFELGLLTPAVRGSRAEVDRLLDPEFREIGASGRLWTRSSIICALAEDTPYESPIEVEEMTGSRVASNLILLTDVTDHAGRRARRSSWWRRTGGQWRLLFHQGTLTGR